MNTDVELVTVDSNGDAYGKWIVYVEHADQEPFSNWKYIDCGFTEEDLPPLCDLALYERYNPESTYTLRKPRDPNLPRPQSDLEIPRHTVFIRSFGPKPKLYWQKGGFAYGSTEIYVNWIYKFLIGDFCQTIVLHKKFMYIEMFENLVPLRLWCKHEPMEMIESGRGMEEILFMGALMCDGDIKGVAGIESNIGAQITSEADSTLVAYRRIDLDWSFGNWSLDLINHPVLLTHKDLVKYHGVLQYTQINEYVDEGFYESFVEKAQHIIQVLRKNEGIGAIVGHMLNSTEYTDVMRTTHKMKKNSFLTGYFLKNQKQPTYSSSSQVILEDINLSQCVQSNLSQYVQVFGMSESDRYSFFAYDCDCFAIELERNFKATPDYDAELLKSRLHNIGLLKEVVGKVLVPRVYSSKKQKT